MPAMSRSTLGTKCPFCRQRYKQANAYEKHLQSRHAELYETLYNPKLDSDVSRRRSSSASSFEYPIGSTREGNITYPAGVNESDYGSASDPEEPHASDGEESQAPTSSNSPGSSGCTVDPYENAGRPLADMDSSYRFEEGLLNDPWRPFRTLEDFKLARWFIKSKVSRSRIDEYFVSGLSASSTPCFRSAYKLDQYIDALDPYQDLLAWNEGTFKHADHTSTFFYRDIVHCVEYLLAQPTYREDTVYGPIREYDGSGQRLYSEMHTGDWWWETQVGYSIFIIYS